MGQVIEGRVSSNLMGQCFTGSARRTESFVTHDIKQINTANHIENSEKSKLKVSHIFIERKGVFFHI